MKAKILHSFIALLAFITAAAVASAQSGGPYTLSSFTLASGASACTSGGFSLAGTFGQPDAGMHSGEGYTLVGGFWNTESGSNTTDSDHDGIPDEWEQRHGLNPRVHDGTRDSDGDGISNYQEYVANTHPLYAQSYLELEIALASGVGPSPMISWVADTNRVYQIWMRSDLDASWVDSGFGIIQPAAGVGPSPMRAEFGVGPSPMYKLFGVGPSPMREVSGVGPSPMRLFRIEVKLPPAGR